MILKVIQEETVRYNEIIVNNNEFRVLSFSLDAVNLYRRFNFGV